MRTASWLAAAAVLASCGGGGGTGDDPPAQAADGRAHALAVSSAEAARARWSAPIGLSLVPAAGAALANGKVLFWSADARNSFGGSGHTFATLFDPATNTAAERNVTETGHDMFCPGTARLPDGRLLVSGGLNNTLTSLYNPDNHTWARGPVMNIARGYNASTPLPDGSVLTLGGSWNVGTAGRDAEIYTAAGGWRRLPGVTAASFLLAGTYNGWQTDSHFNLIPAANGRVLYAGPAVEMQWIDTRGNGSVTPAGRRGDDGLAFGGNTVMYEAGKILKVGGASWNGNTPASATAYVIDTTGGHADVRKLAPMAYARIYANSVVLPDGKVVVIGGQTYVQEFSDSNAVLAPELFDPATGTFTVLPSMTVPRSYHSIAMLLPDGRVISAGGGLCGCAADHPNLEILSPPYLFNADGSAATRPAITAAPATAGYGASVTVTTDAAVASFSLVRMGAVTHTVNNDQRRITLAHTALGGNSYQLAMPTNPGILLPGQWMLFAINAQGTPSVARIITVDAAGNPTLENPGVQTVAAGGTVRLPLVASSANGASLSFRATGLPAGLSIDPATGVITGVATVPGSALVTVFASNGSRTVSTDLLIDVTAGNGTGAGLLAQYHANLTLSGAPALQRVEAPNFQWGAASPGAGVPADNFSARWSGHIEAPASGATRLRITSDDGVRVWVKQQLLVDRWVDRSPTADTVSIDMAAGQRYPILIEYFERAGDATAKLEWQPPGASAFTPVPASRLYAAANAPVTNLALGKTATQSSQFEAGAPGRAVDGNTNGVWTAGSLTHTQVSAQPWWQVDLGRMSRIALVQLWNRTDCCTDRLSNFTVFVSATDMAGRSLSALLADPTVIRREVGATNAVQNITVPVAGLGRYVRVQLQGSNALSLAEVQVWGGPGEYHTPAIATPADRLQVVGQPASFAVGASDPDGNPLAFGATGLPPGISIDATSGLVSGTPSAAGRYTVQVTARNDGALSASTTFTWTVLDVVPGVAALPAPVAASGSTVSYAPVMSAGASSQYSWNFGDGSGDTAWSASAAASHLFAAPGVYNVTLTINTADGRTTTYDFVQAVYPAGATGASARASGSLLLEPRSGASTRVWVVNPDNDSVSVLDAATGVRTAEIAVGTAPRSIARAADGRIWVANQGSATVSVLNPATLAVVQTVALPRASQPFGLLFGTGGSAFVALEGAGRVLRLDGSTGVQTASLDVGPHPRQLALTADGQRLLVPRFITPPQPGEGTATVKTVRADGTLAGGELLFVDTASMAIERTTVLAHSTRADTEASGRGVPNYLGAPAISPDGRTAWVPSKQDNLQRGTLRDGRALDFQNTVRAISSRIDLAARAEVPADRIDHDNASLASAAAYHPTGAYLFVALETSRQVAVVDAAGRRELMRFEAGLAPQGLAVSADGLKLYVHNFMGRSVSEIDLVPLVGLGRMSAPAVRTFSTVGTDKLAAAVLRGKQLFYDARDPRLARDAYMSCAACHSNGGHDGRTWDMTGFGEGLRNTTSLRGRAATGHGFMHWSANFDELQDFEGQIRTLAGGTGLMADADFNAGTRSQPLGTAKAGLSADLDALAAYVASLDTFAPSPQRAADGSLTAAAAAGKALFTSRNCAACHGGTAFTNSGNASGLKDIGTLRSTSGQRLGGTLSGIDVPTLRDVWATAPYLHDGSAATVADAIAAHNSASLGGSAPSPADMANLVAYVQQIGSDEAAAPAPIGYSPVYGSTTGGTAFTDPVAAGQRLTGFSIRHGWWIDAIQGLAAPANLPMHGGGGGNLATVTLAANESIVRFYGLRGSTGIVTQLRFVTSTGRVLGPYGQAKGQGTNTAFDFTVPAGQRVLGFTGRSSASLDALGVIYGP